jgi:cytochrome c553
VMYQSSGETQATRWAAAIKSLERHAGMGCRTCDRSLLDEGVETVWLGKCASCHKADDMDRRP